MKPILLKAVALCAALTVIQGSPNERDVIPALPANADGLDAFFQPLIDHDTDSCYHTAAIDPDGNYNKGWGLTWKPQEPCRALSRLLNSNAYSRRRCNNQYCAIMYEYYFEKDQGTINRVGGHHRHDFENVVVFTKGNQVVRVAASCHGRYKGAKNAPGILLDGKRPYIVYHNKGFRYKHCFRLANKHDVERPENHGGRFYTAPLVSWERWPSKELRDTMYSNPKFKRSKIDKRFGEMLKKAAGKSVPGFDPFYDENEVLKMDSTDDASTWGEILDMDDEFAASTRRDTRNISMPAFATVQTNVTMLV